MSGYGRNVKSSSQPYHQPALESLRPIAAALFKRLARGPHSRKLWNLSIVGLFVFNDFMSCSVKSSINVLRDQLSPLCRFPHAPDFTQTHSNPTASRPTNKLSPHQAQLLASPTARATSPMINTAHGEIALLLLSPASCLSAALLFLRLLLTTSRT